MPQGADRGREHIRQRLDHMLHPSRKKTGKDVNGDMPVRPTGSNGPSHCHPKNQHTQRLVSPEKSQIKRIAQHNLDRRQNDHEPQKADRERILKKTSDTFKLLHKRSFPHCAPLHSARHSLRHPNSNSKTAFE